MANVRKKISTHKSEKELSVNLLCTGMELFFFFFKKLIRSVFSMIRWTTTVQRFNDYRAITTTATEVID